MSLWIKICGMTTPEAVEASLDAGVDAIGFVFAQSVRQVTPEKAATLAATARGRVLCAAVTRHPTQQAIDEIVAVFKPDLLQTDAADLTGLRLPAQLTVLPVYRQAPAADLQPAADILRLPSDIPQLPARVLFEGPASGSGRLSDWRAASRLARQTELILAGGLTATNVAEAIGEVHPFGVDVSSGVEERPGIKSQAAIARFVSAARSVAP